MARPGADSPLDDTDYTTRAAENTQEMAGTVTEQAREYGEKAEETARQARSFVGNSLREQPLITLAGVAAIGLVLGAL
jgi:ElaB/YqjD/DUF883 family membrane-anchored ribosome-binding protein